MHGNMNVTNQYKNSMQRCKLSQFFPSLKNQTVDKEVTQKLLLDDMASYLVVSDVNTDGACNQLCLPCF